MKSKTSTKWYYCRHCNTRHKSKAMADLCFDLDMKILEQKERKLTKIEKNERTRT
jgi:3-hydroxymyristoyl/3-hydroxydecanoyl-(acyl carrier protein) dehydratase